MGSMVQGNNQNYLLLFDAIDRMDEYQEQSIKDDFAHLQFVKQLHVAKNYLLRLIMKSLRGYYLKDSVSARIKAALTDAEILFKRDLLKLSYQAIIKAEKLAVKLGDDLSLLEVLKWKRKLVLNLKDQIIGKKDLDLLNDQEQEILKNLKNESKYWWLTLNIDRQIKAGVDISQQHPLLQNENAATTHRAKILYYHLLYIHHTMSNRLDLAESSINNLIEYFEANEFRLKDDPGPYITALNNKIGIYLNQKKYSQVQTLLQTIRDLPSKLNLGLKNPISLKIMVRNFNVELETYRDSGEYSLGISMIPRVQTYIKENLEFISTDYLILLHYQFAYLYFMAGDFSNALQNINMVLNYRYQAGRDDIVGYAQFLNLIIHYELGNSTVMKYAVDSSRRYLRKRGNLLEFEKVLLRLFSKLSTTPNSQHTGLFSTIYKKLFDGPALINASQLDYLDFKYWLQKKARVE
ncbi:MAG: hypothetical protein DHS20C17_28830 [Cyclobacteriaceae bacterium]|nr:MAG: hypothetical protein DHS20C17_28830 [Cyclobacteriaceae bacterium]